MGQRTERELHEELFTSKLVDGVAKCGRIGQLLLAGGDDNEHRPGLDPPAEEGKQAQAHLISPVDVLQDQKCRPETGEMADRLSHGSEDLPVVGGTDGWLASRTRQLGDQACQLGAPDGSHAPELLDDVVVAERVHPRPKGKRLLAFIRAPQQDAPALLLGARRQLGHDSGLADARLADEGDEPAMPIQRLPEETRQPFHFGGAADERSLQGRDNATRGGFARARMRARRCCLRRGRAQPQDLLIEFLGLGLGFQAQLALEHTHAVLVLP